jgi:hypothetical protein
MLRAAIRNGDCLGLRILRLSPQNMAVAYGCRAQHTKSRVDAENHLFILGLIWTR